MGAEAQNLVTSQLLLADRLAGQVQAWSREGWPGVTNTTYQLLRYWFSRDESAPERFYECQQRAIETIVYCHEILHARTLEQLYRELAPDSLASSLAVLNEVGETDFARYCLKMATGTGKTWVLLALLIWNYFNRLNNETPKGVEGDTRQWYTTRFLVVAPGHEVLNRLLDALKGRRD